MGCGRPGEDPEVVFDEVLMPLDPPMGVNTSGTNSRAPPMGINTSEKWLTLTLMVITITSGTKAKLRLRPGSEYFYM